MANQPAWSRNGEQGDHISAWSLGTDVFHPAERPRGLNQETAEWGGGRARDPVSGRVSQEQDWLFIDTCIYIYMKLVFNGFHGFQLSQGKCLAVLEMDVFGVKRGSSYRKSISEHGEHDANPSFGACRGLETGLAQENGLKPRERLEPSPLLLGAGEGTREDLRGGFQDLSLLHLRRPPSSRLGAFDLPPRAARERSRYHHPERLDAGHAGAHVRRASGARPAGRGGSGRDGVWLANGEGEEVARSDR